MKNIVNAVNKENKKRKQSKHRSPTSELITYKNLYIHNNKSDVKNIESFYQKLQRVGI